MVSETRYARSGDVSIATRSQAKGRFQLADRGVAALLGIPGEWRLFAVE